jgi:hypothetical protein
MTRMRSAERARELLSLDYPRAGADRARGRRPPPSAGNATPFRKARPCLHRCAPKHHCITSVYVPIRDYYAFGIARADLVASNLDPVTQLIRIRTVSLVLCHWTYLLGNVM